MTHIICRASNCLFWEDSVCTSEEIEYEPDAGCLEQTGAIESGSGRDACARLESDDQLTGQEIWFRGVVRDLVLEASCTRLNVARIAARRQRSSA